MEFIILWLFAGLCGRELLSDYRSQPILQAYKEQKQVISAHEYVRGLGFALLLGPLVFGILYAVDFNVRRKAKKK